MTPVSPRGLLRAGQGRATSWRTTSPDAGGAAWPGMRPGRGPAQRPEAAATQPTLEVKGHRWGQTAAPGRGCVDTRGCWEPPRRPEEGGRPPAGRLVNQSRSRAARRARSSQRQEHEPAAPSGDTRSHQAAPGAPPALLPGEGPGRRSVLCGPLDAPHLWRLGEAGCGSQRLSPQLRGSRKMSLPDHN